MEFIYVRMFRIIMKIVFFKLIIMLYKFSVLEIEFRKKLWSLEENGEFRNFLKFISRCNIIEDMNKLEI